MAHRNPFGASDMLCLSFAACHPSTVFMISPGASSTSVMPQRQERSAPRQAGAQSIA